ncbi:P-loop containing nucleoside triphosphate hydrolase protein [Russula dissimulans]|nr:P-loop containing nucleoside triphosphate hydrolase protein [Russula dissimulans]
MEFDIPPAKRPEKAEDSLTESESDSDVVLPSRLPTSGLVAKKGTATLPTAFRDVTPEEDSVTESESDDELPVEAVGGQPYLGPLPDSAPSDPADAFVLDAKHHIRVPPSLSKHLRPYQREGVQFFFERYILGRGAVLGDDMGLGKTVQVISLLSALMRKSGTTSDKERRRNRVSQLQDSKEWQDDRKLPPPDDKWPTALIVTPSSVVNVWTREFEKWGYFEVGAFIGTPSERERVLNDFTLGRLDVVVTSFDTARRSLSLIDNLPWTVLIVDEAHRLKNPKSSTTRALASFYWPESHPIPSHVTELTPLSESRPSTSQSLWAQPTTAIPRTGPIRIALTGTAIQNSYMELWTLLDWANPGSVGTEKQWKKTVANPLAAGQAKGCKEEERLRASGIAKFCGTSCCRCISCEGKSRCYQGRTPQKYDEVIFCPLTEIQITAYKQILGMEAVQNMIRKDEPCDCCDLRRKECCHPFAAGDLFKYMSALIKVSNHLALILPAPTDTPEQTARNRELTNVAFRNDSAPKFGPAMLLPAYCGKWIVLETLLKEWHRDPANKVLIFTKSVKLLEMLDYLLKRQHYGFVTLDGSTKQEDRMPLIDRFQNEASIFVFLISTLAGGTGLNLTAANKVVVFDPAHDLQAMDRAYRFGQTRDVFVYRLLGAGSIEELIYARQVYKQQQMAIGYNASVQTRYFSGVSGDKKRQGELFGLKNIFALHEDTWSTKMAIEHAHVVNLDWALAHMDTVRSKKTRRRTGLAEDWVYEAEMKETVEDADLKGLGALLLDDNSRKPWDQYSHRNDDILVPNTIEEQRMRKAKKVRHVFFVRLDEEPSFPFEIYKKERRKREKKVNEQEAGTEPEFEWPPKRKHHKPPPSPRTKYATSLPSLLWVIGRLVALIELSMIQTPDDLPSFAQDFIKKRPEEQTELLAKLDAHGAPKTTR